MKETFCYQKNFSYTTIKTNNTKIYLQSVITFTYIQKNLTKLNNVRNTTDILQKTMVGFISSLKNLQISTKVDGEGRNHFHKTLL